MKPGGHCTDGDNRLKKDKPNSGCEKGGNEPPLNYPSVPLFAKAK